MRATRPGAVGYSARLINYFFRGRFFLSGPNNYEDSLGEIDVLNDTAEVMNGAFEIYYDDAQGTWHLVGTAESDPIPVNVPPPIIGEIPNLIDECSLWLEVTDHQGNLGWGGDSFPVG